MVVPQVDEDGEPGKLDEGVAAAEGARSGEACRGVYWAAVARVPHRPGKRRRGVRRYYRWAEVCAVGVRIAIFPCPNCGGVGRLLAAIQDPSSIERVLRAMVLPFEAPELAAVRAPAADRQSDPLDV